MNAAIFRRARLGFRFCLFPRRRGVAPLPANQERKLIEATVDLDEATPLWPGDGWSGSMPLCVFRTLPGRLTKRWALATWVALQKRRKSLRSRRAEFCDPM